MKSLLATSNVPEGFDLLQAVQLSLFFGIDALYNCHSPSLATGHEALTIKGKTAKPYFSHHSIDFSSYGNITYFCNIFLKTTKLVYFSRQDVIF